MSTTIDTRSIRNGGTFIIIGLISGVIGSFGIFPLNIIGGIGSLIYIIGLISAYYSAAKLQARVDLAKSENMRTKLNTLIILSITFGILLAIIFVFFIDLFTSSRSLYPSDRRLLAEKIGTFAILIAASSWIVMSVANYFFYKVNEHLAEFVKIDSFKTGGKLIFIGTLLAPILIGFLIAFVGQLILLSAFFSIPPILELQSPQQQYAPPAAGYTPTGYSPASYPKTPSQNPPSSNPFQ